MTTMTTKGCAAACLPTRSHRIVKIMIYSGEPYFRCSCGWVIGPFGVEDIPMWDDFD